MKFTKKSAILFLIFAMIVSFTACGNSDKIPNSMFEADSAAMLLGTVETGGPINFTTRLAAYDMFANEHVVVRVKLQNELDYCKFGNITIPRKFVIYKNNKLVINRRFFIDNYDTAVDDRMLTVFDKQGNSDEIPLVVASKIIYTPEEFIKINTDESTLRGVYVLGNDIDFTGTPHVVLGCITDDNNDQYNNPFLGTFEGAGFTLSNITVSKPDDYYIMGGVFKVIGGTGTVRNLNIKNVNVSSAKGSILGGLVGINEGTIINCYVEATIQPGDHNEPSGGLAGFNAARIQSCISYSKVNAFAFAGGNWKDISDCFAVIKEGSYLPVVGGRIRIGHSDDVEGIEVTTKFSCQMVMAATLTNCELLESESELNNPSNFSTFSSFYWNISKSGIKLHKMFLPNA